MDTVKIIFNENTEHIYPKETTYYDISRDYVCQNAILGVRINNEVYPLSKKATSDQRIEFFDVDDLIGNKMYKSALKFIFEVALREYDSTLDITLKI